MPAYLIAHDTIHDAETFGKYAEQALPIGVKFGAKMLALAGGPGMPDFQVLEGQPQHTRIAVLEFESEEALRRFFESPEHQALNPLRHASSDGWLVIVPGVTMPPG